MKTVVNKTMKPLKIHLPGGKTLHLGPAKTGQVSDHAVEEESIRKLMKSGEIEIVGEGSAPVAGAETSGSVHESTHGHTPTTVVHPKGNR